MMFDNEKIRIDRRDFIKSGSALAIASTIAIGQVPHVAFAQQSLATEIQSAKPAIENGIAWYNVEDWGLEGKAWNDTSRYYDRLPAKAEKVVRDSVWHLSRHSAGMLARFATNSPDVHVRYKLLKSSIAMPHMPATGVSGVDLYAEDDGEMRWLNVSKPAAQTVTSRLASGIDLLPDSQSRNFFAYLPLYNGIESLEIGVKEGKQFFSQPPREDKPLVFYGTSIMHGACASRPGMAIPAILGRRLNRPTINLGFSGNGEMEKEVGDLLVEIDAALYAIDCNPNMNAGEIAERCEPLVKQIRAERPDTPILLVEDRVNTNARFNAARRKHHAANRVALRKAFENLKNAGVKRLHYLEGENILGDDGEAATDGSHPSDLGMMRYADAYEPILRSIFDS